MLCVSILHTCSCCAKTRCGAVRPYLLQYEVDATIWEEERKALFSDIFKASEEKALAKKERQSKFKMEMERPPLQMSRHIRVMNGAFATPRK